MVEEVEKFLKGALVYHVILQYTDIGVMYCLLFVETDEEEWNMSQDDIKQGQALAYVINKNAPDCSELGYIGIQPSSGGVRRTW